MRAAKPLVLIALVAVALAAGCGSGDEEETTQTQGSDRTEAPLGARTTACETDIPGVGVVLVSEVDCDTGRAVAVEWTRASNCAPPKGASRYACTVGTYRCQSTAVEPRASEPGTSVSCSRSGRSIGFMVKG